MHAPMTETDGLWQVSINGPGGRWLRRESFHTRELASQWISKTLQSMSFNERSIVTGYEIHFTVVGLATTPVPGLLGSYQAVQRHPTDDAGRGQ